MEEQRERPDLENLTFEDFRRRALDANLSDPEKIGFPDSYRRGWNESIFRDILSKLPAVDSPGSRTLDIGPGCDELPRLMIELCGKQEGNLCLVDSDEMLSQLPSPECVTKIPGEFPVGVQQFVETNRASFDSILAYSVLQYVEPRGSVFHFVDEALSLLRPGGRLLIGDVPNTSMRRRFFSSERGEEFHKSFMNTTEAPSVVFNELVSGSIDDSVVIGLMLRARLAGFDSYVLPQADDLPMANRREDLLFVRP